MARQLHTVGSGETLPNIARKYYGSGNQSETIVQSNGVLQSRRASGDTDLDGVPNVYAGDTLVVIVDNPETGAPTGEPKDKITLFLDGVKASLPEGSRLMRHYDACCDQFSSNFVWDPTNDVHRAWWGNPLDLAECTIFAGSKQIFGGKFENSQNVTKPNELGMLVAGRSHTRVLEKSVLPSTKYPIERENEDLFELIEWVLNIWGFSVEELSDNREKFKKVSTTKERKVFEWIADLANTRGRVLSPKTDGYGLLIQNPLEALKPVGRYVEGEAGFQPPEFQFDTTKLHNTYIGSSRGARKAANIRGYRDPYFPEQSYDYIDLQGTKPGDLQDALDYNARKKYRDFFSVPFDPGGGLLNPEGEIWEPGQFVTIKSPSARLFEDTLFLVRNVEYLLDPGREGVVLGIIPPWVYTGIGSSSGAQETDLSQWAF